MKSFIVCTIGGFSGGAAVFAVYGNFEAAAIFLFAGICLETYARKKNLIPIDSGVKQL